MNLLQYILKQSWRTVIICAVTSAISGAAFALLIALVHQALTQNQTPAYALPAFVGLVILALASGIVAQWQTAKLAQSTKTHLTDQLARRMLATPLQQLESHGEGRLMALLTEEIHALVSAISGLPQIMINLTIVAVGVGYLLLLSPLGFAAVCVFMLVGMGAYQLMLRKASKPIHAARLRQGELFEGLRGVSAGAKELKLNTARRDAFLQEILGKRLARLHDANMIAERYFILANTSTRTIFFLLVGLIVFLLPNLRQIDQPTLLGYALFTFYFMGPLSIVMGQIQIFAKANGALQLLNQMRLALADPDSLADSQQQAVTWQSLQLQQVEHHYEAEIASESFHLGPLDLHIERGKVYFVVGGNGSGKTTLLKLLTGLYQPNAGTILLDQQPLESAQASAYRQLFAGVYNDFFLFEQLLGFDASDRDQKAREYLKHLKLDHKVQIRDGQFSTLSLSAGQRKRLALVVAYMEDRDIYFFDEWAADQDPEFKEIFYRELIPELQARGKTLLVISHDDRYFHLADHIIRLENGKRVT